MIYHIDYSSELGVKFSEYLADCMRCNNATNDFILNAPEEWGLPFKTDNQTAYLSSEDCDAGGMLAIECSEAIIVNTKSNDLIWSFRNNMWFPRISSFPYYVKYKEASSMLNKDEYEVIMKDNKIKVFRYGDVKHRMATDNRKQLLHANGKEPSDNTKLAMIFIFFDLEGKNEAFSPLTPEAFLKGRKLFETMSNLPCVYAFSIPRLLQLQTPNKKFSKEELKEAMKTTWHADDANQRYVIETGLEIPSLTPINE